MMLLHNLSQKLYISVSNVFWLKAYNLKNYNPLLLSNCTTSTTCIRLADECLVPLFISMEWTATGRDEITIREPLYVFAVSNLTATMTDEVD